MQQCLAKSLNRCGLRFAAGAVQAVKAPVSRRGRANATSVLARVPLDHGPRLSQPHFPISSRVGIKSYLTVFVRMTSENVSEIEPHPFPMGEGVALDGKPERRAWA